MWNQTKDFNPATAGKKAGYCLANVRQGYNIPAKYPDAISAWNNDTTKHQDRSIPTNVEVPLWYNFGKEGHVNVQLTDGRVWSDGTYYPNLAAYERAKPAVHYLGWSESVNGSRVIAWTPDPIATPQPANSLRINAGTWNARTAPNVNAPVVGNGKAPVIGGQTYGILEIDGNGWAKINFTGVDCWIGPRVYTRI